MKLNYTVETQEEMFENNEVIFQGNQLEIALYHFKELYNNDVPVNMYIEDQEGNSLDLISNNGGSDLEILTKLFQFTDSNNLESKMESIQKSNSIYQSMYNKQLEENEKLKREIARLKSIKQAI